MYRFLLEIMNENSCKNLMYCHWQKSLIKPLKIPTLIKNHTSTGHSAVKKILTHAFICIKRASNVNEPLQKDMKKKKKKHDT